MKEKKNLLAKDVALLLGIPLVTVQRWVHQGKIPCKFKKNEYFFKQGEIEKWAKSHQFLLKDVEKNSFEQEDEVELSLKSGIERGGGFYDLEGEDIYTVLENAVDKISFPEEVKKDLVLDELINREEIASTGIGKGVAIPHPRNPMNLNLKFPIIPVFWLRGEIDFNSVDGLPVFILFLIFSPSQKVHLKILSKLSFCLRDEEFLSMLKSRVSMSELLQKIEKTEKDFGTE